MDDCNSEARVTECDIFVRVDLDLGLEGLAGEDEPRKRWVKMAGHVDGEEDEWVESDMLVVRWRGRQSGASAR